MKTRILLVLSLSCFTLSCQLFKPKEDRKKHEIDTKGRLTTRFGELTTSDSAQIKASEPVLSKAKTVYENANQASQTNGTNAENLNQIIKDHTYGNYGDALANTLEETAKRIDSNKSKIEALYLKKELLLEAYRLDSIEALKRKIAKKTLENYISNPFNKVKDVHDLKKKDMDIIQNNVDSLLNLEFEKLDSALLENAVQIKILVQDNNTIGLQLEFIEGNANLNYIMWDIHSRSYFKTGSANLSDLAIQSISANYNRFLDSVFFKIQTINSAHSIKTPNQYQLKLFIDGYADSETYKNRSQTESDRLNQILSEERANVMKTIFETVFLEKTKKMQAQNISFMPLITFVKGHGVNKPSIKVTFKPDGEEDINRRITMAQCLFMPIEK